MKYKAGDRVKIKSLDWYNENKDENGHIPAAFFDELRAKFCGTIQTIANSGILLGSGVIVYGIEDAFEFIGEEAIEGLVEEEVGLVDNLSSKWVNEFELPNGYIFKDENGNVINATKIVLEKKKKEYPKNFKECQDILGEDEPPKYEPISKTNRRRLVHMLEILLTCRDAYWKIAGEEMGLEKPWKPDYDSGVDKFGIINLNGVIQDSNPTTNWERHLNKVLDFPTAEMQDAFYENFKELIEQCKELL